jgi:hypothetical protein
MMNSYVDGTVVVNKANLKSPSSSKVSTCLFQSSFCRYYFSILSRRRQWLGWSDSLPVKMMEKQNKSVGFSRIIIIITVIVVVVVVVVGVRNASVSWSSWRRVCPQHWFVRRNVDCWRFFILNYALVCCDFFSLITRSRFISVGWRCNCDVVSTQLHLDQHDVTTTVE